MFIYIIVALAVRKQMNLTVGLCRDHARKRMRMILAAWGVFSAAVALFVALPFVDQGLDDTWGIVWIITAMLLALSSGILGVIAGGSVIKAKRIGIYRGVFKGAGDGFLQNFSSLPGAGG